MKTTVSISIDVRAKEAADKHIDNLSDWVEAKILEEFENKEFKIDFETKQLQFLIETNGHERFGDQEFLKARRNYWNNEFGYEYSMKRFKALLNMVKDGNIPG